MSTYDSVAIGNTGWRQPGCPHCAETRRQVQSLEVEIARHIEARNVANRAYRQLACRLEGLALAQSAVAILDDAVDGLPEVAARAWRQLRSGLAALL